jgi:hypothetical protein
MVTSRKSGVVVVCALACIGSPLFASAAFTLVNGALTEQFTGTTKDLVTWQQATPGSATIIQNDSLTMGPSGSPEYVTRSALIAVGDSVRVTGRANTTLATYVDLVLTTNTTQESSNYLNDSYFIGMWFNRQSVSAFHSNSDGSITGQGFYQSLSPIGNTDFVMQIQRNSATRATFTILQTNLTPISQFSWNVPSYTGPLCVSLDGGGSGSITFDNVVIPEPVSAWSLAAAALLVRRRSTSRLGRRC